MYHRVNDAKKGERLCVLTEAFEKQMGFLKKHAFKVISLQEAYAQLSGQKPFQRGKQVVITFDDGYEDNFTDAFPVLKKYGFSATIFLTAGSVGQKDFLSWEQARTMAADNISFGAHTLKHPELSEIPASLALAEIAGSKRLIEAEGLLCDFFCYPKGDFNAQVKLMVARADCKAACSIKPGENIPSVDLMELRRTEISGCDSLFDFRKKLSGAFDRLHALIQAKQSRSKREISARKNVLYVIWSLGLGGAERVVIDLAKNLDTKRFNPMVCCLNEPGVFAGELEQAGVPVFALHKKGKVDLSLIFRLVKLIGEHKIDILHAHLFGANCWGRIAGKIANVKTIIITIHNVDISHIRSELFFDKLLAPWADGIIAVGNAVKEFYASKTGINKEKIKVIYNGVPVECVSLSSDTAAQLKKELTIEADERVFSVIGRLVAQKGHQYLFEALRQLNGSLKVKLLVVGDGPLRKDLESLALRLGIGKRVVFTGLRKDVPSLLQLSDCLLVPSLFEGIPMVILEAMSKQKCVIATEVGGNNELVIDKNKDQATGVLVPPADPAALKNAIECLAKNDSLTARLGAQGYQRLKEHFSVERMVEETQDYYLQLGGGC